MGIRFCELVWFVEHFHNRIIAIQDQVRPASVQPLRIDFLCAAGEMWSTLILNQVKIVELWGGGKIRVVGRIQPVDEQTVTIPNEVL